MGIDIYSAQFLRSEAKRGIDFGRLLTLGHQAIYMDREAYRSILASTEESPEKTIFADDLFYALGAKTLDIMDASKYEGANILHNLSEPVKPDLFEQYDCIFDGGTLEHIFNFPIALQNCLNMVKIGGQFITITPANAQCGHGFYQFSPELFYNALSVQNGFLIERLLFAYRGRWYSVKSPSEVKSRIELPMGEPIQLYVSAKRIEKRVVFASWPQQSDYSSAWDTEKSTVPLDEADGSFKKRLLKSSSFLRTLQARWRTYKQRQKCRPSNKDWFTQVEIK